MVRIASRAEHVIATRRSKRVEDRRKRKVETSETSVAGEKRGEIHCMIVLHETFIRMRWKEMTSPMHK